MDGHRRSVGLIERSRAASSGLAVAGTTGNTRSGAERRTFTADRTDTCRDCGRTTGSSCYDTGSDHHGPGCAPVVETYLQNLTADAVLGAVPSEDHYFLGRMDMGATVDRKDYLKEEEKSMQQRLMGGFQKLYKVQYQPLGFSWMVYADRTDFDREHYDFRYARREFLGDVRCLVFDVTPKKGSGKGRFLGRIWVEDQGFNIVRLNGTYYPAPRNSYFFHMDSWRLNLVAGYWVPAFIYSEEGDFSAGAKNKLAFKAQTRIWGYELKKGGKDDELTQIRVDSVTDESPTAQDASPLQAERAWQQQAEDNVVERLTNAGLLAPTAMLTAFCKPS